MLKREIQNGFRLIERLGDLAIGALAPPRCPLSDAPLTASGLLSGEAWRAVDFIAAPFCGRCGLPFSVDYGVDAECPACIAAPPDYDRARAAIIYGEAAHKLAVGFKYNDRTEWARMLAGWMARAGAELLQDSPLLLPVPLHPKRLAGRRYNQSALLAKAIAARSGAVFAPALLRRIRATPPQQRLSAAARQRNVAGAFATPKSARAKIEGKRVVLIDDVLTTGATLSAAARCLKGAAASGVDALVLARVVKGGVGAI